MRFESDQLRSLPNDFRSTPPFLLSRERAAVLGPGGQAVRAVELGRVTGPQQWWTGISWRARAAADVECDQRIELGRAHHLVDVDFLVPSANAPAARADFDRWNTKLV